MDLPAVIAIIVAVAVVGLLAALAVVGMLLGLAGGALWWATALYHALKPDPPPTEADTRWSRDQGKEVK